MHVTYLLHLHEVILAVLVRERFAGLPRVACFAFKFCFECLDRLFLSEGPLKLSTPKLTNPAPMCPNVKLCRLVICNTTSPQTQRVLL
jgi:hypothetical protein